MARKGIIPLQGFSCVLFCLQLFWRLAQKEEVSWLASPTCCLYVWPQRWWSPTCCPWSLQFPSLSGMLQLFPPVVFFPVQPAVCRNLMRGISPLEWEQFQSLSALNLHSWEGKSIRCVFSTKYSIKGLWKEIVIGRLGRKMFYKSENGRGIQKEQIQNLKSKSWAVLILHSLSPLILWMVV